MVWKNARRPKEFDLSRFSPGLRASSGRNAKREAAAPAQSVALGRELPIVHSSQPARQREAYAQPAEGTVDGLVGLREEVEHPIQHLGTDADAVIADHDGQVVPLHL